MPAKTDLVEFNGRHWETGSLQNALAHRGALAPHTGRPYSEALLLGVSGGIAFGYFVFEYKGYLPHLALLTRNTFDPLETIFDRLAIPRDVQHTTNAATAHANLVAALDAGHAALVWADWFSLPHNDLPYDEKSWAMRPVLVHAYEGDTFFLADRSRQSIRVRADTLARARGRVKQDRYRLVTVDPPDPAKLASAVQKGIWGCIGLFTEAPPKGAKDNFGFAAYQKWAKMLVNERNKQSWARIFAPGERMYNALAGAPGQPGAFDWIMTWGAAPGAERGLYAGFLDEAALILKKPALREAAAQFRLSSDAWSNLAAALLPDAVPPFAETRALLQRKHDQFIEHGAEALPEIQRIHDQLRGIQAAMKTDFPLSARQAAELRLNLRERVVRIQDLEVKAVEALQAIMA